MQQNLLGVKVINNESGREATVRAVTASECGAWLYLWVEDADGHMHRWTAVDYEAANPANLISIARTS